MLTVKYLVLIYQYIMCNTKMGNILKIKEKYVQEAVPCSKGNKIQKIA